MDSKGNAEKTRYLIAVGLLGTMILLSALFPDTGDDWFREGLGAGLHSPLDLVLEVIARWRTTNGRILGNVLAYAAGSRPVLKALLRGGILAALTGLAARVTGLRGTGSLFLCGAVLLALPKEMFAQVYPWAAGFFNYVPPVAVILGCFLLMEGAFAREPIPATPGRMLLCFLGGFCGQLFVEHCTIFAVFSGVAILAMDWRNQKRPSPVAALYLLGTVLGAALLFLSPAYRQVTAAGGAYNSGLAGGLSGMLDMARENGRIILDQLIVNSPVPLLAVTVPCAACCLRRGTRAPLDWVLLAALLLTALVLLGGLVFPLGEELCRGAGLLWLLLIPLCGGRWLSERQRRNKAVFFSAGAVLMALPLLAVDPIGPRCLYGSYVFLLMTAGAFLAETVAFPGNRRKAWIGAIMFLMVYTALVALLVPVRRADVARRETVEQAMESGQTAVALPRLPHGDWFWEPDSEKMMWTYYYQTPGDLTITFDD